MFSESGEAVGANYGIFIRKTDGSSAVRLGNGGFSALSPDGKWVAAITNDSPPQIQILPIGAGQSRRLTNDGLQHTRVAWIPDGTGLIFIASEPNHPPHSYWMDLSGRARVITPEGIIGLVTTPDSKYLLASDPAGKWSLYSLAAGGGPQPLRANLVNRDVVRFESDGKNLLVAQAGMPERLFRVYVGQNRREEIRQFIPSDPAGVQEVRGVRLSADGKSYVYSYYRILSDLWVVDGLK